MSDNDSHDEGAAMRKSQRKITKKQVFELKDEPTIKRTKKFKTNPDGSPIVPGYPQTYHAVLADAVASGGLPLGVMGAQPAAAGADGAPASAAAGAGAAARAASLAQQQTSSKTSKRSNKLYCLCQKPYEQDQPMIRCDECHEWYHFACLGVTDDASIAALEALDPYRCGRCMTGVTQKKPRKPTTSTVGKKRKSKRNDDDDAASEEENDSDARRPIDPNDPQWVNPYADLLADPVRCQQYSQSQLDQMRQFMNYNRAEYAVLQQQIAAQQQQAAAMQAQAAAAAQAQAQGATAAAAAAGSAPAAGTDAAAAAPAAAAAAAAPDTKA